MPLPDEIGPRRRRTPRWILTLIVIASLIGVFSAAPSIVTPLLAGRLSALLEADVRIGWITWNPLVGRVVMHRIAIAPTKEAPAIATAKAATIDVALRRYLHGERALDTIVLDRPWISLQRTVAGDFNLADMAPSLVRTARVPPTAVAAPDAGSPVPIRIGSFRIHSGSIEFRDETTSPAIETSMHVDDASARDLILASDGSAGLKVHVESRLERAPLTIDVEYTTEPDGSRLTAKIVAAKASLARALLYVPLGWQRTSGTMDAALAYERRVQSGRLLHHTVRADLTVHDLALTEPWATEPMLTAETVRVPSLAVDLVNQRTDLGAIKVENYRAIVLRDGGRIHVPLASGSPERSASSTWQTTMERVTLGTGIASLRNVLAVPETTVALKSGTIRLPANDVTFALAGTLASGTIVLDGRVRGDTTTLGFAFSDLDLREGAPIVGLPIRFAKGRIGGTIDLLMTPERATLTGKLDSIDASSAPDEAHPEEVIAWQRLEATISAGTLDPLRLSLSHVRVVWPYVMLHRRTDGIFPFTANPSETSPGSQSSPGTGEQGPWLRLDRMDIEGGRIEFWDSTLPEAYGIDLTDLTGAAEGISAGPTQVAALTLRGALDELSPLIVTGRIDPAATTLDLRVERLLLPPLNPYLAPALGYAVESGLARMASTLRLSGSKLAADTDLVLSRFAMRSAGVDTVGGRIGTPLSVALALLKDTRGDIRLHLPIEGDLASNEYRVGSLLREALGTALLGTLRAPLGFLRGIFRKDEGEQFELRPIPFSPGSADLGADGERRIGEVARLLGRQTMLRAQLLATPSRADLETVVAEDRAQPLDLLARLAADRTARVHDRLTHEHGIDPHRVSVEPWVPAEPDIEGASGVEVRLRTD